MPTLEWIGKEKVINHHLDVPFRVLDKQYTYSKDDNSEDSGNMIIKGDNLQALKALLPQYERLVDCIYIDPPYNTGNEGWIYNDNVNDPKIRKWLGEAVGKEGEDLSRHDKWLCMMYPRLKLLQKLLADDGVIFISIDDNELANLRLICDEIFGGNCFVSNVSWQRNYSARNDSKGIVNEVEHLIVYSKRPNWNPNKLPRTAAMDAKYKNPDDDHTPWKSSDAFAPGAATHQGMVYAIQHPITGKMIYPSNGACWRYQQSEMLEIMQGWCEYELRDLNDAYERATVCGIPENKVRQGVKGIVLSKSLEESAKQAKEIYKRGQWPRFYFTKQGKGGIARKTYLSNVGGRLATNFWPHTEVGHTDEAKKELLSIFGGRTAFSTPKPTRLLEFVLRIAADQEAVVLDSFAGSGTTAHAVLNLNQEDGGNRRFILVEMEDYAENITAERVRCVIDGYGDTEGAGGGFSFFELGESLLYENGNLNETIPVETIREYIWYTETKQAKLQTDSQQSPYYLGEASGTAYYFYYEKERATTLDMEFLKSIHAKASQYIIYADQCAFSPRGIETISNRIQKNTAGYR